jgi:site-specific DNA-cytosine methylase
MESMKEAEGLLSDVQRAVIGGGIQHNMKVLDAFCGAGGTGMGLHRAGMNVTGIDKQDMSAVYPFKFIQGDAIQYVLEHGAEYDLIVAGPPCQFDAMLTAGTNAGKFRYPDLLEPTREALLATGKPYIIEQPPGKATKRMKVKLKLCGEMFGLRVLRHRNFETHMVSVIQPKHLPHRGRTAGYRHGVYYRGRYFQVYGEGGGKGTIQEWQQAMDIDWTDTRKHIAEAIPPAYSEYIGRNLVINTN